MKRKMPNWGCLVVGALGLAMLLCGLFAVPDLPSYYTLGGMLMGAGSAATMLGFGWFFVLLVQRKKPPEAARRARIEENDERNIAIRHRAGDLAGKVLFYAVCALAPIGAILGNGTLVGVSIVLVAFYTILQIVLLGKVSNEM